MKSKRHAKILELIDKYDIETQEELADRLNESGFSVTQATISRDIRELKLSKVSGSNGRQKYVAFIKPTMEMTDKYSRVLKCREFLNSLILIMVFKFISYRSNRYNEFTVFSKAVTQGFYVSINGAVITKKIISPYIG